MPFAELVFHNAKLLLMQLPRFCINYRFSSFPSGAAVCAQHMELDTLRSGDDRANDFLELFGLFLPA